MTLLDKVLNYADGFDMLPESGLLLLCVSGGADSMCLLEVIMGIAKMRRFTVCVAHFNHHLRGGESDRDEAFVRDYCAGIGVPFYSGGCDVRAHSVEHGLGIEEAARDLRYGFFYEVAEKTGAERIVTAHTADDNTETVIMNLVRGAGAAGLSGIPPKRGMVVRPMLCVGKGEIIRYIAERGIKFVEDSTNCLDIYTRNRIRHTVIPALGGINPKLSEAVSAASALSRADEEYLSEIADRFIAERSKPPIHFPPLPVIPVSGPEPPETHGKPQGEGCSRRPPPCIDAMELAELPFAVSGRVIRKLCGGKSSYKHVMSVLELCKRKGTTGSVALPGITVYNEYGRVVFIHGPLPDGFAPILPEDGRTDNIPGLGLKISCKTVLSGDRINKSLTSFLFKYVDICGKITVRPRREGDTIRLIDRRVTKTLKKLYIERRIPARERGLIPVVADDAGVLAVYGFARGDRAVPAPGDLAFQIEFEEIAADAS